MKLAVFASLLMIILFQAEANTCVNKKVLVWVTHGKNLGDGLQSPDPYVVVKIGSDSKKTKVINSSTNPSWMEKMEFPEATSDMLQMEVWDKDDFTADDKLGTCMVPMSSNGHDFRTIECKMDDNTGVVNAFYRCF
ncbi:uncharacterized protein LOC126394619 isoform X3 [Epinephelus moara]|uniref:uncharacterized protein LOC126394619 isoform X3 n=1 Tax=Epinephelus moara TaxID=300413 RepID=UPI00214E00E2|nr:uncharacterized protein LOC126394619 isoform X3 [Epinephelus moara]